MTDQQQHSITPPPELVRQWTDMWYTTNDKGSFSVYFSTMAAQWGADQELEACCALLELSDANAREFLRAARRPKPLSLKEQALGAMGRFTVNAHLNADEMNRDFDTIRRALEELPND